MKTYRQNQPKKTVLQFAAFTKSVATIFFIAIIFLLTANEKAQAQSQAIPPDFFGLNGNQMFTVGGHWGNAAMRLAIADRYPSILRYPGGTVANWFSWIDGWFLDKRKNNECFITPDAYHTYQLKLTGQIDNTLDQFRHAVHLNHATPMNNLNMLTSDINTEIARLMAEREMNIPIKKVELGSEFYMPFCENVNKYLTGLDYSTDANNWITNIKMMLGYDVNIGALAALPTANTSDRANNWNSVFIPNLIFGNTGAQAVTLHRYAGAGTGQSLSDNVGAPVLNSIK